MSVILLYNSPIKSSNVVQRGEFFIAKKRVGLVPTFSLLEISSVRTQSPADLRTDDATELLVRIARKLSKLEPKVLLRNFLSVEQNQENLGNFLMQGKCFKYLLFYIQFSTLAYYYEIHHQ